MFAQTATPRETLSITLPPEVDADLYRARNSDLRSMSDEQLVKHYPEATLGQNKFVAILGRGG